MYSTYQIETDKLDTSFIEGIKKIFKGKKVEIVIHDIEEEKAEIKKAISENKSAQGIFHEYANPSLIEKEKDAWGEAMRGKHRVG